jgi:hypothetical protein
MLRAELERCLRRGPADSRSGGNIRFPAAFGATAQVAIWDPRSFFPKADASFGCLSRPTGLTYLPTKSAMTRMSSPTSNGFAK